MKRVFNIFARMCLAAVIIPATGIQSPLCAQNKELPAVELTDQPYGSHPMQKFDIYLPEGRNTDDTPVLFMIHGGGWAAGDKSEFNEMIAGFRTVFPHMAFVSVGYRLADGKAKKNQFPTQEEDVKACIEYVLDNRDEYGISTRLATYGGSAGAHLGMLYAYKHGPYSYPATAVISLTGPVNMSTLYDHVMQTEDPEKETYYGWFLDAVGGPPAEKEEICRTSSPVNYVTENSPPTLMIYGADDTIVPRQQPEELAAKLTEAGVIHTYRLHPGQWHDLKDVWPQIIEDVTIFLNTHLK